MNDRVGSAVCPDKPEIWSIVAIVRTVASSGGTPELVGEHVPHWDLHPGFVYSFEVIERNQGANISPSPIPQ